MKIGDKIKKLREERSMLQSELCEILGIEQSTLANYENNRRIPNDEIKSKIADHFNVTVDYLLGRDINKIIADNFEIVELGEMKKIPIVGVVRCGPDGLAFEDYDGYIQVESKLNGDVFALRCKGDSMIGMGIFPGDVAVVKKQETVECGELAVVIVDDDEGILKKVRIKNDFIMLESANQEYPPRVFVGKDMQRVKVVGKVIRVIKDF